ncbi:thymidylate kinase [Georgfuchsia toluolica]|uniref:Thymidylate kinase n=1 Tax=Georgfuchsia toluolica TaxID=424218 RepID=A0A916J1H0_9PROT|nr:dTMP kinase [Georgfuchsia toluolica]CAG4882845.1 thymidylate kinase [Georgfuchsia toluolica]
MRGRFITFEGIDGAGKSTHHTWMVEYLRAKGHDVVSTREPGGTPLGEKLRGLLLSESMDLETEAMLMFAARREHIVKVIEPALATGQWVVSDRFTDASFAYQGGGRGLAKTKLQQLEIWVQEDLQPNLTFLFDLDVATATKRLQGTGQSADRFEQEKADFFERVRQAYLDRAKEFPLRFRVIDASLSIAETHKLLENIILSDC